MMNNARHFIKYRSLFFIALLFCIFSLSSCEEEATPHNGSYSAIVNDSFNLKDILTHYNTWWDHGAGFLKQSHNGAYNISLGTSKSIEGLNIPNPEGIVITGGATMKCTFDVPELKDGDVSATVIVKRTVPLELILGPVDDRMSYLQDAILYNQMSVISTMGHDTPFIDISGEIEIHLPEDLQVDNMISSTSNREQIPGHNNWAKIPFYNFINPSRNTPETEELFLTYYQDLHPEKSFTSSGDRTLKYNSNVEIIGTFTLVKNRLKEDASWPKTLDWMVTMDNIFTDHLALSGMMDLPKDTKIDGDLTFALIPSDIMKDSETKLVLDDVSLTLSYHSNSVFNTSISGEIQTLRDGAIIHSIPFGEYYGKDPIIHKADDDSYNTNINLCVNGSLNKSKDIQNYCLENLSLLLEGAPDTIRITNFVIGTYSDKVVEFSLNQPESWIYCSLNCPFVLDESAVLHTSVPSSSLLNYHPTTINNVKELDIEIKIRNDLPLNVTIPRNGVMYAFSKYSDECNFLECENEALQMGNKDSADNEGTLKMHITFNPAREGNESEHFYYLLPLRMTVGKENEGKEINGWDGITIVSEQYEYTF